MPGPRRAGSDSDNVIPMRATGEDVDEAAEGASAPDVLDLRAEGRDKAAEARDRAAEARVEHPVELLNLQQITELRALAARDRAAAALDRKEAALDRLRAAEYLRRTYRDELTGALQRQVGRERLVHEVQRAQRFGDELVIAFLDVVHLKGVNDTRGHDAGDKLLAAVGSSLHRCLRSYDVVVRYGGDEFVCPCPRRRWRMLLGASRTSPGCWRRRCPGRA